MNLINKKVLITGSTGFIGSNLLRYLAYKGNMSCFAGIRKTSDLWRINDIKKKINLIELDLTNKNELKKKIKKIKPEIIFHLSTFGGVSFQDEINTIIETNLIGTLNLMQCASELPLIAFINTGSSSEYGLKNSIMKENQVLEPVSYYGFSKASANLLSKVFNYQSGLPIVNLRLFSPYGYYDHFNRLIPYVIVSLLTNQDVVINNPDSVRDYIFIDDIISAYLKALKLKDKKAQVYNIGCGRMIKIINIVEIIKKHITSYSKITINKKKQKNIDEPEIWQASIKKAKDELNWEPKNDINKGLIKTINWYKKNIHLYKKHFKFN